MRFPITNLLLAGVALAAPIQELNQDKSAKALQHNNLLTRGLISLIPRVFVAPRPPVAPGRAPPPRPGAHDSPDAPVRPADRDGPGGPVRDKPEPLISGDRCMGRKRCANRDPLPGAKASVGVDKKYDREHVIIDGKDTDFPDGPIIDELGIATKDDVWYQNSIRNDPKVVDEWLKTKKDKMRDDMVANGWSKDEAQRVVDNYEGQLKPDWDGAKSIEILVTKENPKKGTIVVETSYNADKDLLRPQKAGDGAKWSDTDKEFVRPALTDDKKAAVVWSEQVMDNWRVSAHEAGVPVDSLNTMIRDRIQTPATRQLVKKLHGDTPGKKTWEKGTPEFEEMIKDKVHGDRPNQMLKDNKDELNGLEIKAFDTYLGSGGDRVDIKIIIGKP